VERKESMMMLPKVSKGEKRISLLERENNVWAAIGLIRGRNDISLGM
jgi:hypothetical protein